MNKKTIAITGTTGLLGRNFLFELAKKYFNSGEQIEIILLGRSNNANDHATRIFDILCEDGSLYCGLDSPSKIKDFFSECVRFVEMDLRSADLGISSEGLSYLNTCNIDKFFHIAALTDFRDSQSTIDALWNSNVEGTKRILSLVENLKVGEFNYVGSAYSCGCHSGYIAPDFVPDKTAVFRNPYEKSKLEAELEVRSFEKRTGLPCKYFRPSTICGRLLEPPLGSIHKFDVFYGWAQFFLRAKFKALPAVKDIFATPLELPVRILCSDKSGLNIVPADYAAKLLYEISYSDSKDKFFHLVNNEETLHHLYLSHIMKTLNIAGTQFVLAEPEDKNQMEKLYYKTVGKIYTPYTTSDPILFDTSSVKEIAEKRILSCPKIDDDRFSILMEYAKKANFGIDVTSHI
jgi:nucleoside-diphosphate-sugar epimerase